MSFVELTSLAGLQTWVEGLIPKLGAKRLILLSGPMGSGKTEFVRALARATGIRGVSSPTYAIHQRYLGQGLTLDHVDLYRLNDGIDLESSGFWDLFFLESGLIVVEWADRLDNQAWPKDWPKWQIRFELMKNGNRLVHMEIMSP